MLIQLLTLELQQLYYLNTSNVNVNLVYQYRVFSHHLNLNTSNVNVNLERLLMTSLLL